MIGLGTNRLSASRLAGLTSEWQHRNGQWIERSPYSAAATRALKAAFSAAQWAIIRDYGFAHPALVPFINEDPMLVMSLIEGLGTRWLEVETVGPYISSGITGNGDNRVQLRAYTSSSFALFGNDISDGGKQYCLMNGGWGARYGNGGSKQKAYNYSGLMDVDFNKNNLYYNDTLLYNFGYENYDNGLYMPIFAKFRNTNTGTGGCPIGTKISYVIISRNDITLRHFVPFICQARTADKVSTGVAQAAGTCGMIDLLTGIFYPNANSSGSFTISESPS